MVVYLDLMVVRKTFEKHQKNLEEIFKRLRNINPKKQRLFQKEFLNSNRIWMRFYIYYRRFIKKFVENAKPPHKLTEDKTLFCLDLVFGTLGGDPKEIGSHVKDLCKAMANIGISDQIKTRYNLRAN